MRLQSWIPQPYIGIPLSHHETLELDTWTKYLYTLIFLASYHETLKSWIPQPNIGIPQSFLWDFKRVGYLNQILEYLNLSYETLELDTCTKYLNTVSFNILSRNFRVGYQYQIIKYVKPLIYILITQPNIESWKTDSISMIRYYSWYRYVLGPPDLMSFLVVR